MTTRAITLPADHDETGWLAFYAAHPGWHRSIGAAGVNDDGDEFDDNDEPDAGDDAGGDSRFEARLDQIASAVEGLTRTQRDISRSQEENAKALERQQLEARITAHGQRLAGEVASAESAVETAERALAAAHDEGDSTTTARAQRALSEAIAKREGAKIKLEEHRQARARYDSQRQQQRGENGQREQPNARPNAQGQEGEDFTNLNRWKNQNSAWYGVDPEMTRAAHEIDQKIRAAGVIEVGSTDYFDAINRQMRQRYPDRLGRTPDTAGNRGGANGNGGGGGGGNAGRIPASLIDGWRRMGIDVEKPETLQRMLKHREHAVRKGLLPERPVYDRVRT
jgi:hypothetical protein